MLEFSYNKEKKLERMSRLIALIENLFNKFTTNKNVIGYTLIIIHILYVLIIILSLLFCKPTIVNIALLIAGCIAIHCINGYYGGGTPVGCVLIRLERYFFKDKEYYGGINTVYRILNKSKTPNMRQQSEEIFIFLWLVIFAYIIYKISKIPNSSKLES